MLFLFVHSGKVDKELLPSCKGCALHLTAYIINLKQA